MHSIRLRFMLSLLLLLSGLLLLLNIYPAVLTRDAVFQEKQRALTARASALSGSLSTLERFSAAGVAEALQFLDLSDIDRVVVFDESGALLYDSAGKGESVPGDVRAALGGQVVFRSRFARDLFQSSIAMPISGGTQLGVVLLQEADAAHAEALRTVRRQLLILSLSVTAATLLSCWLFIRWISVRLRSLVRAMRAVSGGEYQTRWQDSGRDEISALGTEFNDLTECLERTEEERRRFVADASHELKTPVSTIRLYADSILNSPGIDADTAREFVTDIREEAVRLQKTTEKLLALSRLDGQTELALSPLDLSAEAERSVESLRAYARERYVALQSAIESGCVILGARDELDQILYNLIDNAIKYNIPGGSVLVELRSWEGEVMLTVEDTGIGIPEDDLPHIFDRFYRVDKARSREAGGSGLGLSIVHDAVLALGGSIYVEKNRPQGTRFLVRFPRAVAEE